MLCLQVNRESILFNSMLILRASFGLEHMFQVLGCRRLVRVSTMLLSGILMLCERPRVGSVLPDDVGIS